LIESWRQCVGKSVGVGATSADEADFNYSRGQAAAVAAAAAAASAAAATTGRRAGQHQQGADIWQQQQLAAAAAAAAGRPADGTVYYGSSPSPFPSKWRRRPVECSVNK